MFWMNFEIFMSSPQVIYIYEKGEACIFPKTKFLIFRTFEHNPRKFWVHIYHFYINSQLFSACSLPQHSTPKSQFVFESQFFKFFFKAVFIELEKLCSNGKYGIQNAYNQRVLEKKIYSLKKKFSLPKIALWGYYKTVQKFSEKNFRFEPTVYQWTLPAPFWHPSLVFSFHTCVLDRFFRFPNFL